MTGQVIPFPPHDGATYPMPAAMDQTQPFQPMWTAPQPVHHEPRHRAM